MIIGTAGHVDHGKTSLVKALTGTDTDRLDEERTRGLTIDIGFAYSPLSDGSILGFVDLPGHERFMKNMLAGAAGIDLVLLVIAADDGIMPQTREHLAVVQLLGIKRCVVALTKCDLVDDSRIETISTEITDLLSDSPLESAPIFALSAHRGFGIDTLRRHLETEATLTTPPKAHTAPLKAHTPSPKEGPLRFAIDRSFTLPGAGVVVTGTVMCGTLQTGGNFLVSPSGTPVRIRSLHVQDRPGTMAHAGQRCGVNLGGRITASTIRRGDMLLDPCLHAPTNRIDAELFLLESEPRALRHWSAVRLHHAAAEIPASIALLQESPVRPGTKALVQIVLSRPIAATIGDRFVIRSHNGERTIGGGHFIDLSPPQRKRRQPHRLEQLAAMNIADPAASLAAQLERWPWFVTAEHFARDRALSSGTMAHILSKVPHTRAKPPTKSSTEPSGTTYLFAHSTCEHIRTHLIDAVSRFHQRYPQLLGAGRKWLFQQRSEPQLPPAPAAAILDALVTDGLLVRQSGTYRLPGHSLGLDHNDQQLWQAVKPLLGGKTRFRPPRPAEIASALCAREFDIKRVLAEMARQRSVTEIGNGHYFLRETLLEIADIIEDIANNAGNNQFAAAALRDRLANGRKVSIQILEYFDQQGITARRGDLRVVEPSRLARYRAQQ